MVVRDQALVRHKLEVIAIGPNGRTGIGLVAFETNAAKECRIERNKRVVRRGRDLNKDTTTTAVSNAIGIVIKLSRVRSEDYAVIEEPGKLARIIWEWGRCGIASDLYILCIVLILSKEAVIGRSVDRNSIDDSNGTAITTDNRIAIVLDRKRRVAHTDELSTATLYGHAVKVTTVRTTRWVQTSVERIDRVLKV